MKKTVFAIACLLTLAACNQQKGTNTTDAATSDSLAQAEAENTVFDNFDIMKYKDKIEDQAFYRFAKSTEDVRLVDYTLIDIDGDGQPELWVRGDDGQDYQGVFAIQDDSLIALAEADACSQLEFYKNAVGFTSYISPGRVDEGYSVLKDSHIIQSCEKHVELDIFTNDLDVIDEYYTVNDHETDEDGYNQFVTQLGDTIPMSPVWHQIP